MHNVKNLYYDLHIHSCLSPCGEDDMTPTNICGMAHVKGLDVIAVTDHNTASNLPFIKEAADFYNILLVPGIEVTTKEEVHLLGYFDKVENAVAAGDFFRSHLPTFKNKPHFFGNQLICNTADEIVAVEDAMLIGATDLTIAQCKKSIEKFNGVCVPAHINRGSNGLLINLGFIPHDIHFNTLEVARHMEINNCITVNKGVLYSSDAHRLGDIAEKESCFRLSKLSVEEILKQIKNGAF